MDFKCNKRAATANYLGMFRGRYELVVWNGMNDIESRENI